MASSLKKLFPDRRELSCNSSHVHSLAWRFGRTSNSNVEY
ncbi:hypothetical protein COLO4_00305 [Corchorus olitorius]|uniref:Uncharacterized protein n=1 Tax=Corchorus olitorius TaxID=93759 RepID=A0A1R3L459_9ROSI|nr:hypothetical protein COLO4_00305 [Corchorus olitorius]